MFANKNQTQEKKKPNATDDIIGIMADHVTQDEPVKRQKEDTRAASGSSAFGFDLGVDNAQTQTQQNVITQANATGGSSGFGFDLSGGAAPQTQAPQTQQQTQAQPKAPHVEEVHLDLHCNCRNRFNPDLKAAASDMSPSFRANIHSHSHHSHSRSSPHNMKQDVVDLSPLIGAAEHEVVAMDDEQEADVITVDASGDLFGQLYGTTGVDLSIAYPVIKFCPNRDGIGSTPSTGQRKYPATQRMIFQNQCGSCTPYALQAIKGRKQILRGHGGSSHRILLKRKKKKKRSQKK
eukprot:35857_1